MGDLRPDNGGGPPPEEGGSQPQHLPGFPPEWGPVIIPDDAAELAAESFALRRELRRTGRRSRLRTLLGIPTTGGERPPSLGVPMVIMAVAVLTTLVSLFVVTWGRQPSVPSPLDVSASNTAGAGTRLADLVFTDAADSRIRLGGLFPAVILLVDDCLCDPLVLDVADAAPAGVTVVAVGRTPPVLIDPPFNVRALADPDRILQNRYGATAATPSASAASGVGTAPATPLAGTPTAGTTTRPRAAAILVDASGTVASTVTVVESAADIGPALHRLGP